MFLKKVGLANTKITELQSDLFEKELNDADLSTVIGGGGSFGGNYRLTGYIDPGGNGEIFDISHGPGYFPGGYLSGYFDSNLGGPSGAVVE